MVANRDRAHDDQALSEAARTAEDDGLRSAYVRRLIRSYRHAGRSAVPATIPKVIVQFWHDALAIPTDVRECLASWDPLKRHGFRRDLFDDGAARRFIFEHLGHTFLSAFDRCHHPAMRCDYFRLCFMEVHGGFYVDADDHYLGAPCEGLFLDNRLKVHPLCYDTATNTMVSTTVFFDVRKSSPDWIFYVNNNPLIAPPFHPIVRLALARATEVLLHGPAHPDIQSTTGPGNLTTSLVRHAVACDLVGEDHDFVLLPEWDTVAISRWPLSYRHDQRNWRLWNPGE